MSKQFLCPWMERWIAPLLCGVIAAFAMPGASFWPAMFIGLSGFYFIYARTKTTIQAFGTAFLFAFGYFVTGLWWIGNALLIDGNDFAWVWPLSVIGLPTLLSLFTGLYMALARMRSNPKSLSGFLEFCVFLTLSEWVRGHAFTGFPWNLYGYTWLGHLEMVQMAFYVGAYGLTFLTVLMAGFTGFLIVWDKAVLRQKLYAFAGMGCVLAVIWLGGAYRLASHPVQYDHQNAVIVVQPNIAQTLKWDANAVQHNFETLVRVSREADKHAIKEAKNIFIVWPETALSPSMYSRPENLDSLRAMLKSFAPQKAYLVSGILRRIPQEDGETGFANSIALLDQDMNMLAVYDKTHLVPFGEFIPFQDWLPLKTITQFKGFERGNGATTILHADLPSFSPLVCYEIIFPDQIVDKRNRPDWIVNATNDGWYGDSAGPRQHFAQTQIRAIEEGLPIARSANTGISGLIDSYGRVLHKFELNSQGSVASYMPPAAEPQPFDTGRLFPFLLIILGICFKKPKFAK